MIIAWSQLLVMLVAMRIVLLTFLLRLRLRLCLLLLGGRRPSVLNGVTGNRCVLIDLVRRGLLRRTSLLLDNHTADGDASVGFRLGHAYRDRSNIGPANRRGNVQMPRMG